MGPDKQQHNEKNYTKTKKEWEPGLVTFYDIRSGDGVGLFLQPRRLQGALGLNPLHANALTMALKVMTYGYAYMRLLLV